MTDPVQKMIEEAADAMGYWRTSQEDRYWAAACRHARAALESLGVPLETLAALKTGEPTAEMLRRAEEMYAPFGEMRAAWDGFLMGAKAP